MTMPFPFQVPTKTKIYKEFGDVFNVKDFGASGSALDTNGSVVSGSNIVNIDSHIDFENGQGIAISGAGSSGSVLFTKIIAGGGTSRLIIADNASTGVVNSLVTHDDSDAINAAFNSIDVTRGGTVYFPDGVYLCNKPPITTNGYNSTIMLPYNAFSSVTSGPNPVTVAIIGETFPAQQPSEFSPDSPTNSGVIILCTNTSAGTSWQTIIGGPSLANPTYKSVINVVVRNIIIRQPYVANYVALDLSGVECCDIDGIICDVTAAPNSGGPPASSANGAGVLLPYSGSSSNYGHVSITRFYIQSLGEAIMASAHAYIDNGVIQYCYAGIYVVVGQHPIYVGKVNVERNTYDIYNGTLGTLTNTPRIYVSQLDIEPTSATSPGNRIYDPNNYLQGIVNFVMVYNNAGVSGPLPMDGGVNLRVTNLGDVGARSITPPASPLVSGAVYQNTLGIPIKIIQGAYATTSGTAGTVAVAVGASSTPSAIYTKQIPGSTTSTASDICEVEVPPGWYYSFTTSGVTLLDAYIQGS